MNMKKWLLTGACIAMLGALSACSNEDSSNSVSPEISSDSQSGDTASSGDPQPSSAGDPTSADPGNSSEKGSSGGKDPTPASSSSDEPIPDTAPPQMGCSEIMYNAAGGSELEWIEIYIAGGMDIDNMQNYLLHLSGAVDYTFPGEPLKKGEYIVVTNDPTTFKETYPTFAGRLFGPWDGGTTVKLANEGDVVNVKIDGEGDVSCAFGNEPPWPSLADGKGRTLVYVGGNAAQPNSWAASKLDKGNPGVGNDEWVTPAAVRINEIMPNIAGDDTAWIELYNTGDQEVDVAGWTIEVKRRKQTLTIKSGAVSTVIPAKGYVVLNAVDNFDEELVVSQQGGEFYLRGSLEGEESSIWVPAGTGTSGVIDLSDGSTAQGPLASATPGAKNSALKMGSVYINEIHYHPKDSDPGEIPFEFMELVNGSDNDIPLYSTNVQKGWKIEGINMEFGSTAVLPAHGMIVLIPEELDMTVAATFGITNWGPDFVRSTYSIPESVQIMTYSGKLSNRSETIAVKEPYAKADSKSAQSGYVYFYIWHDATLYSDKWPDLKEADGLGYSLQRVDTKTMGYEASAWKADVPTLGK
ncbi:MAG: lamin tail domain-containing protein [Fibrobacter sp.]|nr:lamin tail domain-containing protein [Fibrobacter sp.]